MSLIRSVWAAMSSMLRDKRTLVPEGGRFATESPDATLSPDELAWAQSRRHS